MAQSLLFWHLTRHQREEQQCLAPLHCRPNSYWAIVAFLNSLCQALKWWQCPWIILRRNAIMSVQFHRKCVQEQRKLLLKLHTEKNLDLWNCGSCLKQRCLLILMPTIKETREGSFLPQKINQENQFQAKMGKQLNRTPQTQLGENIRKLSADNINAPQTCAILKTEQKTAYRVC